MNDDDDDSDAKLTWDTVMAESEALGRRLYAIITQLPPTPVHKAAAMHACMVLAGTMFSQISSDSPDVARSRRWLFDAFDRAIEEGRKHYG